MDTAIATAILTKKYILRRVVYVYFSIRQSIGLMHIIRGFQQRDKEEVCYLSNSTAEPNKK